MAATEVKEALKNVANAVSDYVKDASTLTVETQTVQVGGGAPALAAKTTIKLDGDNTTILPTVKNAEGKVEVDAVLYDLHMQNVQAAIDYRSKILDSLIGVILP